MWKERGQDKVDRPGLGGIVTSNCHIVRLIWSYKAVIVMKHRWRWAREGEDYTAWAIHCTIHPFIALWVSTLTHGPGSIAGHVRAGCGLEEGGRSAEVTTLISDASRRCIVHCALTWQPLCEDALQSKNSQQRLIIFWKEKVRFQPVDTLVCQAGADSTPLQMTVINNEYIISSGPFCLWRGEISGVHALKS